MAEVLDVLLSWIATTVACFYVVMRDERRLARSGRKRAAHDGAFLAVAQLVVWGNIFFEIYREIPKDLDEAATRVVLLFVSAVTGLLSTPAAFFVSRRDAKRVKPELLERAWPWASRGSAILGFGQIAVWVHFWKTRRFGARGFFLGVFWAVAALMPGLAIGFVLDLIFPDSK